MSYFVETENKLFQFKDYHGKLFYLLFRTTDESSIQEGGKVTITNSSIFSDQMDIFWLSVFVKLFKRKVKFRHNRLRAQPYIILRTYVYMCRAYVCGP